MKTIPPKPNEFEISVFGPGIGESIVVHLGNSKWAIIDSCQNRATRQPIALEYLNSLNVNVCEDVSHVIVTHWHDDHIRGISEIVQAARNSKIVFSAALKSREFSSLLAVHKETMLIETTSGVAEMHDALENNLHNSGAYGPHSWASEGMVLHQSASPEPTKIIAVSPSANTITQAAVRIGHLIPNENDPFGRVKDLSPNSLSIALQVQFGTLTCLLGGDLEKSPSGLSGWNAVVKSSVISDSKAGFYKVAHHGSEGADQNEIWSQLLDDQPAAVVTPYARGSKKLPSSEDIERLQSKTAALYCTAPPNLMRPARRRSVEKTIREVVKSRRAIPNRPGHVRMRYTESDGNLKFETFDRAVHLTG